MVRIALATVMALACPTAQACMEPTYKQTAFSNPAERRFESVVIAVPGWNGKCSSTFGEAEGHLLSLLSGDGAYDVDCFDYDSHEGTIGEAKACLADHIRQLGALGYKNYAFITHSTGGIIVLDLTVDNALAAVASGGQAPRGALFDAVDGPTMSGLYAWAVPINGLRPEIKTIVDLKRFFSGVLGKENLLPDLFAGSAYLQGLHTRMQEFNTAMGENDEARQRFGFDFAIMQGQASDGVVLPVFGTEPWWPSGIPAVAVNTETGHSGNVADAGRPDFLKFPGEVQRRALQAVMPLGPRWNAYFSPDTPASQDVDTSRIRITDAIYAFGNKNSQFLEAFDSVKELLRRLFKVPFRRDAKFDEHAVGRLRDLILDGFKNARNERAVKNAELIVDELTNASAGTDLAATSPTSFSAGSKAALEKLACLLQDTFEKAAARSGSQALMMKLEGFAGRLIRPTGDGQAPAGFSCILRIAQGVQRSPLTNAQIGQTVLATELANFAVERQGTMPDEVRAQLGEIFTAYAARDSALANRMAGILQQAVVPGGRLQPWQEYLTKQQLDRFGTFVGPDYFRQLRDPLAPGQQGLLDLQRKSIERGGVPGNDRRAANDAAIRLLEAAQGADPIMANRVLEGLADSANRTPFPSTRLLIKDRLDVIGRGDLAGQIEVYGGQ